MSQELKSIKESLPSPEELYQRARDLQPILKARAAKAAELRYVPPETIQDFKDLGFWDFHRLLPCKELDGFILYPSFPFVSIAFFESLAFFCIERTRIKLFAILFES